MRKLIADWNPVRGVWETVQANSESCEHWDVFLATWPKSGMTHGGLAYELPMPALPTIDFASSSSLLPTPESKLSGSGPDYARMNRAGSGGDDLTTAIHKNLLPTPAVNDMGAGKTPEVWDEWRRKMKEKHSNGNGHGPSLAIEAMRLLPTPSAASGSGGQTSRSGSRKGELLLGGVVQSIGDSTAQQSTDGNESSDGQPLPLPS